MSLPWIQVCTNLRTHPKSMRLGVKLKEPRAYLYLVDLWLWAGEACPGGLVEGSDATEVIEMVVGWEGGPGDFVRAAVVVGFLDVREGALAFHDWDDHNGAHARKMEKDRLRRAKGRAEVAGPSRDKSSTPRTKVESAAGEMRGDERRREKETDAGSPPASVAAEPVAPVPEAPPPSKPAQPSATRALDLEVYQRWRQFFHPRAVEDPPKKSLRVIAAARKLRPEATAQAELLRCLEGYRLDDWDGRAKNSHLSLLLRDDEHILRGLELADRGRPATGPPGLHVGASSSKAGACILCRGEFRAILDDRWCASCWGRAFACVDDYWALRPEERDALAAKLREAA